MATPIVVTFYSFRGGVGRSMAMLNAGYELARTGSRVLLIDLDLEAPGLTQLSRRQDLVPKSEPAERPGMADIIHGMVTDPDGWAFHESNVLPIELSPYLVGLKAPEPRVPALPRGRLALITAGTQGTYGEHLAAVRSERFARLRKDFARRLHEVLVASGEFDYILVDSRTGLSDEAYIAARYLCDYLVVLTGLNDQNIEGTGSFLRHVGQWRAAHEGPKSVLLVASPVPEYEDDRKQDRIDHAIARFGELGERKASFALRLPYHPRLSLDEVLVAEKWPESGLGRAYLELADILREMADDTALRWAERATEALNERDTDRAVEALRRTAAINREEAASLGLSMATAVAGAHLPQGRRLLEESVAVLRAVGDRRRIAPALHRLADLDSLQGRYAEAQKRLEESRAITSELGDQRGLSVTLHRLAYLDHLQGRYAVARRGYQESLAIARKLGESRGVAVILHSLADLDRLQGRYPEARKGYEQALVTARELGDRRGLSTALYSVAFLDSLQGRYAEARQGFEEALAIKRELGDRREIALTQYGLGYLNRLQGRYAEARKGFEEALAIKRELGDRRDTAVILESLAGLDRLQGRYAQARKAFEEALLIARELGDRQGVSTTLHGLGHLDRLQGRYAEAQQELEESLAIHRELGDRQGLSAVLHSLAYLHRLQGRYAEARQGFEESLAIDGELADPRGVAVTLHSLADLDRLQGRYAEARQGFEEALGIKRELGDRRGVSVTLHSLADLARLQGRYAEARQRFEEALATKRELGDRRGILVTELYLATTKAQDDPGGDLSSLRDAAKAARAYPDPHVAARSYQLVGQVLRERGLLEEAAVQLRRGIAFYEPYGFRDLIAFMQAELALALADAQQPLEAAQAAREALTFFDEQDVTRPDLPRLRQIASADG